MTKKQFDRLSTELTTKSYFLPCLDPVNALFIWFENNYWYSQNLPNSLGFDAFGNSLPENKSEALLPFSECLPTLESAINKLNYAYCAGLTNKGFVNIPKIFTGQQFTLP